jgi:molecular chaperone GrpE
MSDPTTDTKPEDSTTPSTEAKEAAPAEASGEAQAQGEAAGEEKNVETLESVKAEAAKTRDQLLRMAADFDNFRKRSRKEIEDARKAGKEDLLKEFLPVFDNLDRGMQSAQKATDVSAVAEGLSMVLRQFVDTLGRQGITRVPTVGNAFDPSVHEAIQQVESDEPPGHVVAEVQSGYIQGGRLVRAALVVVAKPKSS